MAKIKAGTYRFNDVLNITYYAEAEIRFMVYASNGIDYGYCNRIYIDYSDERDCEVVYHLVSIGHGDYADLIGNYIAYVQSDGWRNADFKADLQTITVLHDEEVSSSFYEWFTENTVMLQRTIKAGKYRFNDTLAQVNFNFQRINFTFTANFLTSTGIEEQKRYAVEIRDEDGGSVAYIYIDEGAERQTYFYHGGENGASDGRWQTDQLTEEFLQSLLDSGEITQDIFDIGMSYREQGIYVYGEGIKTITVTEDTDVSVPFYEWFVANTIKLSPADIVKEKITNLIAKANATTGRGDTNLTSCVDSLIDGYGVGDEPEEPTIPEYNGVIPLGKYKLVTTEGEDLYLEPEPFNSYDLPCFVYSAGSLDIYNYIYVTEYHGAVIGWAGLGEETHLFVGDTIEVIEYFKVDEETYNIFMHYFTFVGATEPETPDTPAYNGYIPLGKYTLTNADVNLAIESYDENWEQIITWVANPDDTSTGYNCLYCGEYSSVPGSASLSNDEDGASWVVNIGGTIEVTRELEVDEDVYNVFRQCFTFVGATEPETPTIPEYNGYIPAGEYSIDLTRDDIVYCYFESSDNREYHTVDSDGTHWGGDDGAIWYTETEWGDEYVRQGDIYVFTPEEDIEVDEETFNAFMHNFTPQ